MNNKEQYYSFDGGYICETFTKPEVPEQPLILVRNEIETECIEDILHLNLKR